MTRHPASIWLIANIALLLSLDTGCKSAIEAKSSKTSTVIGLIGDARYGDGTSDALQVLKLGDQIPEGSVVQTASGAGNALVLTTGVGGFSAELGRQQQYAHTDKVILFENSILKLNKIADQENSARITRLSLIAGSALCNTAMAFPTGEGNAPTARIQDIAPELHRPDFEIRTANMIVHAEHAVFFIAAGGRTRVAQGAVSLQLTDQAVTKSLPARKEYDPVTGEISDVHLNPHPEITPLWDRLWPRRRQPLPMDRMPPQRPF